MVRKSLNESLFNELKKVLNESLFVESNNNVVNMYHDTRTDRYYIVKNGKLILTDKPEMSNEGGNGGQGQGAILTGDIDDFDKPDTQDGGDTGSGDGQDVEPQGDGKQGGSSGGSGKSKSDGQKDNPNGSGNGSSSGNDGEPENNGNGSSGGSGDTEDGDGEDGNPDDGKDGGDGVNEDPTDEFPQNPSEPGRPGNDGDGEDGNSDDGNDEIDGDEEQTDDSPKDYRQNKRPGIGDKPSDEELEKLKKEVIDELTDDNGNELKSEEDVRNYLQKKDRDFAKLLGSTQTKDQIRDFNKAVIDAVNAKNQQQERVEKIIASSSHKSASIDYVINQCVDFFLDIVDDEFDEDETIFSKSVPDPHSKMLSDETGNNVILHGTKTVKSDKVELPDTPVVAIYYDWSASWNTDDLKCAEQIRKQIDDDGSLETVEYFWSNSCSRIKPPQSGTNGDSVIENIKNPETATDNVIILTDADTLWDTLETVSIKGGAYIIYLDREGYGPAYFEKQFKNGYSFVPAINASEGVKYQIITWENHGRG